jgi:hypothetical protein
VYLEFHNGVLYFANNCDKYVACYFYGAKEPKCLSFLFLRWRVCVFPSVNPFLEQVVSCNWCPNVVDC